MADWQTAAAKAVAFIVIACLVTLIIAGTLYAVAWLLSAAGAP